MSRFKHQPLGCDVDRGRFRVLELLPGSTDQIHCRLIHTALQERLLYEAISYRWGGSTPVYKIVCNCVPIFITANLYSALRRFRKDNSPRYLWADQVCINQDDVDERNHQIGIIRDIYTNATCTLIWLGDSDPDFLPEHARLSFALAKSLVSFHRLRRELMPDDRRDILELTPAELAASNLPRLTDPAWLYFDKIWRRARFDRVWVIQELVVSNVAVLYSHAYELAWDDYDTALRCADELRVFYFLNAGVKPKLDLPRLRQQWKRGASMSLAQLLMEFSRYSAADHRDKIYALVGLADRHDQDNIIPNYRLSESEVFFKTATTLLEKSGNLDVLSLVSLQSLTGTSCDLPNWIPRFNLCHHIPMTSEWERQGRKPPKFFAARQSSSHPEYSPISELGLEGYVLDTIDALGSPHIIRAQQMGSHLAAILDGAIIIQLMATGESLTRQFGATGKYFTGQDMRDVFWQTMVGGCTEAEFHTIREEYQSIRRKYPLYRFLYAVRLTQYRWVCVALLAYLLACILLREKLGRPKPTDLRFFEHQSMVNDRRMFRSRGGLLGLGPAVCRRGDRIALLRGGRVPLVLRPVGNTTSTSAPRWVLVGDAYIHGVMYGEAFDEEKCERIWLI